MERGRPANRAVRPRLAIRRCSLVGLFPAAGLTSWCARAPLGLGRPVRRPQWCQETHDSGRLCGHVLGRAARRLRARCWKPSRGRAGRAAGPKVGVPGSVCAALGRSMVGAASRAGRRARGSVRADQPGCADTGARLPRRPILAGRCAARRGAACFRDGRLERPRGRRPRRAVGRGVPSHRQRQRDPGRDRIPSDAGVGRAPADPAQRRCMGVRYRQGQSCRCRVVARDSHRQRQPGDDRGRGRDPATGERPTPDRLAASAIRGHGQGIRSDPTQARPDGETRYLPQGMGTTRPRRGAAGQVGPRRYRHEHLPHRRPETNRHPHHRRFPYGPDRLRTARDPGLRSRAERADSVYLAATAPRRRQREHPRQPGARHRR
ncbi:Uncharacterised protein [Mycobacteroides abscessus subsp. bolletii]|nr:Uncharacterised protein [Mycobacteroides abscessus subsp. bolletii]